MKTKFSPSDSRMAGFAAVLWVFAQLAALASCSRKSPEKTPEQPTLQITNDDEKVSDHVLHFRSVAEVNDILRSRVIQEPQDFDILNSLVRFEENFGNVITGTSAKSEVASLMGSYHGLGLRVATDSMRPSTVHTMLWGLTIQEFARGVGQSCSGKETNNTFKLNATTDRVIQTLCNSDELQDGDLKSLWDLMLRKDANDHEFIVWLQEERANIAGKKGSDRVTSLVNAMLFGPEFLIGR